MNVPAPRRAKAANIQSAQGAGGQAPCTSGTRLGTEGPVWIAAKHPREKDRADGTQDFASNLRATKPV